MIDMDYMKRLTVAADCTSLEEYDLTVSINGMQTKHSCLDPIWRYFWLNSHPAAAFALTAGTQMLLILAMLFGMAFSVFYGNPVLCAVVLVLVVCFSCVFAACSRLESRFKEVRGDLAAARTLAAVRRMKMPYGGCLSA